jgi:hypothetical protein
LPGKTLLRISGELVVAHIKSSILSVKKKNTAKKNTTNTRCTTYYYGKRISLTMRRHALHENYDAMKIIQIKQNQNSAHIIRVQVMFLLHKLNID